MSNHLINETSPYLAQHSENPVDWYPWGEEALSKARSEDKPVFLSIGYSACHWCHVMAHESFEDAETAKLLNESFISIKVDREERPDIDIIYMEACRLMTGSGGWPLSIFMSPDGKPFYAGTYFPKTPMYGMPSFCDIIRAVISAWKNDRNALLKTSSAITNALSRETASSAPTGNLIEKALAEFTRSFDKAHGGFSQAPKFPSPHILLFLLQQYEKHGDENTLHMAELTLNHMYRGGLFDHIGGGFCRYSTDRFFLVPHFEKMLYDNALLILAYSKAYELTNNGLYLEVADKTADYLLREMKSEEGGFFSSQDADSDGQEGLYYLFTPDEVISVLGNDEGSAFNACYDITASGNFDGKSIPNLLKSDDDPKRFEEHKQKLYEYRSERCRLFTDDKILTFRNALAVTGLCALYRVSGREIYLESAREAYSFICKNLFRDKVLYASIHSGKTGNPAFLDDFAGIILCEIALYGATLEKPFLEAAKHHLKTVIGSFFDSNNGGFFFTNTDNEKLIVRPKETFDGAIPCGNSILTYAMSRLSVLAPEAVPDGILEKQLAFMKKEASPLPSGYSMLMIALSDLNEPPVKLIAVGAEKEKTRIPLFLPLGANIILLPNATEEYKLKDGKPTYYICQGRTCLPPVNELKKRELNEKRPNRVTQ
ncbi:MAG: thioredoxin domain-containing protein [Clostridia bacterium]|nr:thioredoxin domain-containing protein [Clostridia bacterium]